MSNNKNCAVFFIMVVSLCLLYTALAQAAEPTKAPVVFQNGTNQVIAEKTINSPRPVRRENSDREVAFFPEEPLFSIEIQSPIKGLIIRAQANSDNLSYLVKRKDGNAWNNGKYSKEGCWPLKNEPQPFAMNSRIAKRIALSPGVYEVFVGYPKKQEFSPAVVIIHETNAEFDKLSVALPVPDSDSISDKIANDYYPLIDSNPTREQAQEFMIKVDPKLWVYTKVDLDFTSAESKSNDLPYLESQLTSLTAGKKPDQSKGFSFPQKNEPGMLFRSRTGRLLYYTADGASFLVSTNYLTTEKPDNIKWPTTLRNQKLTLSAVSTNATNSEKKSLKIFLGRQKKSEICWRKYVARKGGFTSKGVSLYEVTSVNGKITAVVNYKEKVALQADKKCKMAAIRKEEEKLLKKLGNSYLKRGMARIKQMKAAFKDK